MSCKLIASRSNDFFYRTLMWMMKRRNTKSGNSAKQSQSQWHYLDKSGSGVRYKQRENKKCKPYHHMSLDKRKKDLFYFANILILAELSFQCICVCRWCWCSWRFHCSDLCRGLFVYLQRNSSNNKIHAIHLCTVFLFCKTYQRHEKTYSI